MQNNRLYKYIFVLVLVLAAGSFVLFKIKQENAGQQTSVINKSETTNTNIQTTLTPSKNHTSSAISEPISNALARVTKKPFGIKVSPQNSPVSPEKFSGFHTGVDFETTPEEQNADVPVYDICSGPLILKKWASGYGGVAVQKCSIENQTVTVIYGHIKLASVTANLGDFLNTGQKLGILGKGYSTETDGERKHLHLGIHMGTAINILGYVKTSAELINWLDAEKLLKNNL